MHIYISTQNYKGYMFAKNTYTYIYYVSACQYKEKCY